MRATRQALAVLAAVVALPLLAACRDDPVPAATAETDGDPVLTPGSLSAYRYRVDLRTNADLVDTSRAPDWLDVDEFTLRITIEGERLNAGRERTRATIDLGYFVFDRESVMIGDQYWIRLEAGPWRESLPMAEPADFAGQDVGLSPAVLLEPTDLEAARTAAAAMVLQPFTVESVNGYETRHWVLGDADLDRLFPAGNEHPIPGVRAPSARRAEVWVDTETRVIVRAVVEASSPRVSDAFFFQIDLFDLNDPTIAVEAPSRPAP